jgi:RNA polymerase sigma-70 factor (ECF subfamily)
MLDALKVRAVPIESTAEAGDRDAELVARAKRERQAFGALYDRYLDPIYRYCHVRLGNREAAEDATSVVFAKAMAGLSSCGGRSFRSWLFAIAHNVVADAYRATRPSEPLAAAAALADPAAEPDELALIDDMGRAIRAALLRLSPDQREVVELRLAGLTGPEIAAALGKSHAAIRVAQFRAYARLRILLDATKEADGA